MTNPPDVVLSDRLADAFAYSLQLHRYQSRKVSPMPYISHLMAVTALVLEDGGSEDEAIAALLHDAVEDQGGEPIRAEILRRYGSNVAAIVDACTIPPWAASQSWKSHKLAYLDQLRRASPAAQRIILADKLHNVRSLITNLRRTGENTWSAFAANKADNIWLHQVLAELFEAYYCRYLVADFRQEVNTLFTLTLDINCSDRNLL